MRLDPAPGATLAAPTSSTAPPLPRPPAAPRSVNAEIRGVREELNAARDEQVARVVALVDAMPDRGAADALVAPLRGRLAVLRPGRPFNFTRLLFTPIDPVIVPPMAWRRGDATVPRHTLNALAAIVRSGMGDRACSIDEALARRTGPSLGDGANAIRELGHLVWPEAATILARAGVPDGWLQQTSLSDADFLLLALTASGLLGLALDRQVLAGQIQDQGVPEPRTLSRVVTNSLSGQPDMAAMAVGLLLVDTPRPDLMLQAVDAHAAVLGQAASAPTERAVDFAMQHAQALITAPSDLPRGLQALREGMLLIKALEARSWQGGDRRAQIRQLRMATSESCRDSFVRTINAQLLAPLRALSAMPGDIQVLRLERVARDLRDLELVGRRLGNSPVYATDLQGAAACVRATTLLTLADRVRLVELLAGTDVAMGLLRETDRAAG
nr:hypothetical protein [uncultured Lichenicoccus sp.]